MTASGAFVPGGHAAYPAFEQWRGAPLQYAHDFAPGRAWADVELPDWWLRGWGSSPYLDRMVVSLRMLPNDGSGTLATGATGAYNWHFRRAARRLVARGMGQALVRVGWEANGGWFRWSAKPDPRSWLAYYRQIVLTMRSVAPGLRRYGLSRLPGVRPSFDLRFFSAFSLPWAAMMMSSASAA